MIIKKVDLNLVSNESNAYFKCLKVWLQKEDHRKKKWAKHINDLKVYVVEDEEQYVGFAQVIPIEYSYVTGENMHFIQCILVSPFKDGPGVRQKQGIGDSLLKFIIEDLKSNPKDAIVATSMAYFGEEVAAWYEKRGFERIDRKSFVSFGELEYETLLWIPMKNVEAPKFITVKKKPDFEKNTLVVFSNGWCRSCNTLADLAINIANEYQLNVVEISTLDREKYLEYGIMDGIYFNNKELIYDGSDYEKLVRNTIKEELGI